MCVSGRAAFISPRETWRIASVTHGSTHCHSLSGTFQNGTRGKGRNKREITLEYCCRTITVSRTRNTGNLCSRGVTKFLHTKQWLIYTISNRQKTKMLRLSSCGPSVQCCLHLCGRSAGLADRRVTTWFGRIWSAGFLLLQVEKMNGSSRVVSFMSCLESKTSCGQNKNIGTGLRCFVRWTFHFVAVAFFPSL